MKKFVVVAALAIAGIGFAGAALAQGGQAIGRRCRIQERIRRWLVAWRRGLGACRACSPMSRPSTGNFRVVERAKLEKVLEEQNLAASGRVRSGTGARWAS